MLVRETSAGQTLLVDDEPRVSPVKAEPVDFDEYVDQHWREFRPVLFEGSRPAGSGGTPRRDLVGTRNGRVDIEKIPAGTNLQEFFEQQGRAQGSPL